MIKLIAKGNDLYTPFNEIVDEWQKKIHAEYEDKDSLLLARNDWGEPMTPKWKEGKLDDQHQDSRYVLAVCLFGSRETGQIPDVKEVKLPDDSVFNIEDELYAGEQRRKDK